MSLFLSGGRGGRRGGAQGRGGAECGGDNGQGLYCIVKCCEVPTVKNDWKITAYRHSTCTYMYMYIHIHTCQSYYPVQFSTHTIVV